MADYWNKTSNPPLTILEERKVASHTLPLKSEYVSDVGIDMTVSVISGSIPAGLTLNGITLTGSPFEVPIDTVYNFVVRATLNGISDDRTFKIIVVGPDSPEWITPANSLPVGANATYFILDSAIIDFQLQATDTDTLSGQNLEYFMNEGDGVLPPGITLTKDGRLAGTVDPILALEKIAGSGKYDSNKYGEFPFDFSVRPDNGYSSFFYDVANYDISIPSKSPKKLNRYYQFYVNVTDYTTVVRRKFEIYVVGDDFLRADNTVMQVSNGIFTADNTFVRVPIWLTPGNLGVRRANNYVTIFLDVIDPASLTGIINYSLQTTNPDGTTSALPDGMTLDQSNGEIAGRVPYQALVTRDYQFTIRAKRLVPNITEEAYKDKTFTLKLLGEVNSTITWTTPSDLGTVASNYSSVLKVEASSNVPLATLLYTLKSGKLPQGLSLSLTGEILGTIRSYGTTSNPGVTIFDNRTFTLDNNATTIDRNFTFTVSARDHFGYSVVDRQFTLKIKDPDGKLYSNVYFQPMLKNTERSAFESIITNNTLFQTDFIYRPNDPKFGVQRTMRMLVYAGIESKSVAEFVAASAKNHRKKRYRLGAIRSAVAKTPGTQSIVYEVVYVEVIDPAEKSTKTRTNFRIKNKKKITVDQSFYDYGNTSSKSSVENLDPNGIEIETQSGNVKYKFYPNFLVGTRTGDKILTTRPITIGVRSGTDVIVAESIGSTDPMRFRAIPINTLKTDFSGITIDGDTLGIKYISNVSNMRDNIKKIGTTDISYLPLWMQTSQIGNVNILGYTKAIPLCYCKPGKSVEVLQALTKANITFNQFNFDIDRYVVDQTLGNSAEQYILFHNYAVNV